MMEGYRRECLSTVHSFHVASLNLPLSVPVSLAATGGRGLGLAQVSQQDLEQVRFYPLFYYV